ncbi:hypothetical protein PG996_013425 [Apiospora saccharicola]|uniref:Uncharacterized protein n=1 Tax=Apiospora saccharicola TaxID=335842 RepID=A0ABR1U863_9PEZI
MTLLDDIFYYSCCFIVVLHSLSALLVITHGRCTVYAAAFLIASAMWVSLSVLNLWFFLPTVVQDAAELVRNYEAPHANLGGGSGSSLDCVWQALSLLRVVVFSSAASYFYMMLFGWFVGAMSLSNALTMWQREGCDAMEPHSHNGRAAACLLRAARRVEGWVAIEDQQAVSMQLPRWEEERTTNEKTGATVTTTTTSLATTTMTAEEEREEEVRQVRKGGSFLFAVPRQLHSCYMVILAPHVRLPESGRGAGGVEISEKGVVL